VKAAADPGSPLGFRSALDPRAGGGLKAFDLKTGKLVWSANAVPCPGSKPDCSPAQSAAVTAIPGVVFSGSVDGHLRAYSAATGEILWDTDTDAEFRSVNGGSAHGGSMGSSASKKRNQQAGPLNSSAAMRNPEFAAGTPA